MFPSAGLDSEKELKFSVMAGNRTVTAFGLMTENTAVVKFCPLSHQFRCPLHKEYSSNELFLSVIKEYNHVPLRYNSAARVDSYLDEIYSLSKDFRPQINNRIEPAYNDIALCKNSSIAQDIIWYQLFPHC
jgi:hypothetical protein